MREIIVEPGADRAYSVMIGLGILKEADRILNQLIGRVQVLLVSNPLVFKLYGENLKSCLDSAGFTVSTVILPDGEEYKNMNQIQFILDEALKTGMERESAMLALGGGVIGDMTGFAASICLRGISYVQVPTTLLAQVDSSVGGKTGVNHQRGKNLIGTFYQPNLVIIDPYILKTLKEADYLCGLGEVVKYGVIYDRAFFEYLEHNVKKILHRDYDILEEIICHCVRIKSEVVARDEKEQGLRAVLNLGHTFGHSLEKLGDYRGLKHGEAVAKGIYAASLLAVDMGILEKHELFRIKELLEALGLSPVFPPYPSKEIYKNMLNDKKVMHGKLRLVLPAGIGGYKIIENPAPDAVIKAINSSFL